MQENLLIPERAVLPRLAANAAASGMIDHLAAVLDGARRVGVRVYFVVDQRRKDRFGHATNIHTHRHMTSDRQWSGGHGPIVSQLTPRPEDVLIERQQAMTGFFGTPLDAYFRNTGVRSVILTGCSANLSVLGTTFEAMNLGYQVLVAADCIVGDPPEFIDDLLRYVVRNVALVTTSSAVLDYWGTLPANPVRG